ncbi:hypothetical protein GCM10020229_15340 [Kitasatospora albolonga]
MSWVATSPVTTAVAPRPAGSACGVSARQTGKTPRAGPCLQQDGERLAGGRGGGGAVEQQHGGAGRSVSRAGPPAQAGLRAQARTGGQLGEPGLGLLGAEPTSRRQS